MTRLFAIGLLSMAALLSAADSKDVHKTLPLEAGGTVSLENHKGSIRITAWDRSEVEVHATIQPEPGTTMNQRAFDGAQVIVEAAPNSIRIRTVYPELPSCCSNNESLPEVKYEIHMPRSAHLRVRDHRSTSEIAGIAGGLDLDTHRGSVRVTGLSGPLRLTTHRGDIRIAFTSLTANSTIETHVGTVELSLPRNTGFELHTALEKRASFQSDFSLMMKAGAIAGSGSKLHATVNGGGPSLHVESHRGEIRIRAI